jgi:hypothetical protein
MRLFFRKHRSPPKVQFLSRMELVEAIHRRHRPVIGFQFQQAGGGYRVLRRHSPLPSCRAR